MLDLDTSELNFGPTVMVLEPDEAFGPSCAAEYHTRPGVRCMGSLAANGGRVRAVMFKCSPQGLLRFGREPPAGPQKQLRERALSNHRFGIQADRATPRGYPAARSAWKRDHLGR